MARLLHRLACLLAAALLALGCYPSRNGFRSTPELSGFRADTWIGLDAVLDRAVASSRIPGGVIAVGRGGRIVYLRAAGYRRVSPSTRAMYASTLFDVASLTKPVATATAAAVLAADGRLSPGDACRGATVQSLLRHTAGWPAYADWRETERVRAADPSHALDDAISLAAPRHGEAQAYEYSNVGYALLALDIQRRAGMSLEAILAARAWRPLGMESTTFSPAEIDADTIAATSAISPDDAELARPYDPLADYILRTGDGLQPGHSGLFSNASDLTRFAQALLRADDSRVEGWPAIAGFLLDAPREYPVREGESPANIALHSIVRSNAFEFDSPDGAIASHTGYTGSLLWMDRKRGVSLVVLTNATLFDHADFAGVAREAVTIVSSGAME